MSENWTYHHIIILIGSLLESINMFAMFTWAINWVKKDTQKVDVFHLPQLHTLTLKSEQSSKLVQWNQKCIVHGALQSLARARLRNASGLTDNIRDMRRFFQECVTSVIWIWFGWASQNCWLWTYMVGFEILTLLTGSVLKPDHKSLSSHVTKVIQDKHESNPISKINFVAQVFQHCTKAERGFHDSGGVFKIGINLSKRGFLWTLGRLVEGCVIKKWVQFAALDRSLVW